jgi:hypothetical protein
MKIYIMLGLLNNILHYNVFVNNLMVWKGGSIIVWNKWNIIKREALSISQGIKIPDLLGRQPFDG